jgi:molecular chaperone GrpE
LNVSEEGERAPDGEPGAPADEGAATDDLVEQNESLKKQLEGERARADENYRHWQRAQADFVNYKRRTEQERADLLRYANASLVAKLLPIVDDFERAERALPSSLLHLSWIEGVFLISYKLLALLQHEGLAAIEAVGKQFDPVQHEAVIVEPGVELGQGEVVEELQRGYRLGDRVIRPTLVKVGPPKASTDQGQTGGADQGGDG